MKAVYKIQYHTRWGESLELVSGDVFYPMKWGDGGMWSVEIEGDAGLIKGIRNDRTYVVKSGGIVVRCEWTHHCGLPENGASKGEILDSWIDCPIPGCPFPMRHSAEVFDRPGYRGAGTAIPVFSLRGKDDFGVGEFTDLPTFVDWMEKTGQNVLQLLPINDTTRCGEWGDSYPYNPVSAFALHPIYIHLQDIGVKPDRRFRDIQKKLNSLPAVDYPEVMRQKTAYMLEAFAAIGEKDKAKPAYKAFIRKNADWLDDYANQMAARSAEGKGLCSGHGWNLPLGAPVQLAGTPDFYKWVQFHLDRQLRKAVDYAHSKGVFLKGDLPIGVGRDSVDASVFPKLFNLDSNAGAPPDFFSRDGQNWGFPTYNWEEMAGDNYAWWKRRLRKMSEYFDAYRIDHILGFFRIWEIPADQEGGRLGHFNPALPYTRGEIDAAGLPYEGLFVEDPRHEGMYHPQISPDTEKLEPWQKQRFSEMYNDFFFHRHNEFWKRNALRKLPHLLGATGMLACGEDLGMVPDCVNEVMSYWKILSLEMQRMDKGHGWPLLSVCATSSHDMTGIRLWNAEDHDPVECRRILQNHLASCSMLAIFPLQDWLSMDGELRNPDPEKERINDPADPHNKWCWRMHIDTTTLVHSDGFNEELSNLIKSSDRSAVKD